MVHHVAIRHLDLALFGRNSLCAKCANLCRGRRKRQRLLHLCLGLWQLTRIKGGVHLIPQLGQARDLISHVRIKGLCLHLVQRGLDARSGRFQLTAIERHGIDTRQCSGLYLAQSGSEETKVLGSVCWRLFNFPKHRRSQCKLSVNLAILVGVIGLFQQFSDRKDHGRYAIHSNNSFRNFSALSHRFIQEPLRVSRVIFKVRCLRFHINVRKRFCKHVRLVLPTDMRMDFSKGGIGRIKVILRPNGGSIISRLNTVNQRNRVQFALHPLQLQHSILQKRCCAAPIAARGGCDGVGKDPLSGGLQGIKVLTSIRWQSGQCRIIGRLLRQIELCLTCQRHHFIMTPLRPLAHGQRQFEVTRCLRTGPFGLIPF